MKYIRNWDKIIFALLGFYIAYRMYNQLGTFFEINSWYKLVFYFMLVFGLVNLVLIFTNKNKN